MADDVEAPVAVCFVVKIDDQSLGTFDSCDGLGMEFVMETREEGGQNGMVWQLPTRIKWSNVKLTRPVSKDTEKVTKYFAAMAAGFQRKTAVIEARTLHGEVVTSWSLAGVIPVKWSGPQLGMDNNKIAMETLELAHHGFLGT
ncbi:phage tail protein [Fodinicola feengrottensis]|uniref:Phage tail protein n=1 Tax=Fodinicola feengrottensis TaxID=435914 RepID=A0ABN2FW04_9ACTN|nr:phage tail protein [Fodinicola feengrottensis]